ncbi:TPA: hypothetical protein ACJIWE_001916 [Enterobacter roggenkampii]
MKQKFIEWFTNNNNGCSPAMEDDRGFVHEKTRHMFEAYLAGVAEGEARCAALAAENAGLKAALRPSDIPSEWTDAFGDTAVIEHDATGDNQGHSVSWSWVGNQEEVIKSVLLAVDKSIETTATDTYVAEVRAQGVEMFADHLSGMNISASETSVREALMPDNSLEIWAKLGAQEAAQ